MTHATHNEHVVLYDEGNKRFKLISIRSIVMDPQFRSGYRDRLAGRPPKRFFFDEQVGKEKDTWGYERGRLLACWLLATGQPRPKPTDVTGLALVYLTAQDADVVL